MVREMNTELDTNMNILERVQFHINNYDPDFEKLRKMDANKVLSDASKEIKVIKYKCNNAVVTQD